MQLGSRRGNTAGHYQRGPTEIYKADLTAHKSR
jgi:hypothetical protein